MRTIFNRTWIGNYIGTEETTLFQLDGYNKTRYSRRKKQEGLLELASREAHEKQQVYFATILSDDDSPYCAIESNIGYFGLDFLQENCANYLMFTYKTHPENHRRLFLRTIILSEHAPGTSEKIRRVDFLYEFDGSFHKVIYQGKAYDGTSEEIITKHSPISEEELQLLWVDYPEFGKYDQLIRLDRIPHFALEHILAYTDKEFPRFREYLQRDIDKYHSSISASNDQGQ